MRKKMKSKQKTIFPFKTWLMATTSMLALSLGFSGCYQQQEEVPSYSHEQPVDSVVYVDSPVTTASFRTDTIPKHSSPALFYHSNGQITHNYVEKDARYRIQLTLIAHENWHHHNSLSKYRIKYKFSPMQYAKLCMHDEISATLAAILTADLEYQTSENKDSVMRKYENTYMGFYFKAVKEGKIKTGSLDKADNDAKYRLLVNGAIEMWQDRFLTHYAPSRKAMLIEFISKVGFYKPVRGNYKKILSHMYTFGGVDLSKYIEKDVRSPELKIKIINNMVYCNSINGDNKQAAFIAEEVTKNIDKLKEISVSKQRDALEHLFVAAKLKYELSQLDVSHAQSRPEIVAAAYNKVMYTFAKDQSFSVFIENCYKDIQKDWHHPPALMPEKSSPVLIRQAFSDKDAAHIRQFYTYKGQDLSKSVCNFDMNRFPSDKLCLMNISDSYYEMQPSHLLAHQIAYLADKSETYEDAAVRAQADKKSSKVNNPVKKQRLSGDQYVEIPDFEQPLFVEGSMNEQQWQTLKNMFEAFDNIESVYKGCDADKLAEHIKKHGRIPYFEKADPFLRKSKNKKRQKLSLNTVRQKRMQMMKGVGGSDITS